MNENQLVKVISDSGLDKTKSQILLENFSNYFEIAADWENKAKMLTVTSENQKAEMKMAREGRLFLKEKRIAVENTRKQLKEQSLREGQTIDAIAKILKNLIEPIEDYLEHQEKFVEIQEMNRKTERKEKRVKILTELQFDFKYYDILNMPDEQFDSLVLQIENERDAKIAAEKKAEEDRIAREKAEAEERERIRLENIRLRYEAEKKEKQILFERKQAEEMAAKEKAIADKLLADQREKAAREKAISDAKLKAERDANEKLQAHVREKAAEEERIRKQKEQEEAERKLAAEKAAKAPEKERLLAWLNYMSMPPLSADNLSNEAIEIAKNIQTRFKSFKTWAESQIETL